jgi:hypothetical protein
MMNKFEVQTYTICDGWQNIWHDDVGIPETFDSHEDAVFYLDEHIKECFEDGIEEDKYNYRIIKKESEYDN